MKACTTFCELGIGRTFQTSSEKEGLRGIDKGLARLFPLGSPCRPAWVSRKMALRQEAAPRALCHAPIT